MMDLDLHMSVHPGKCEEAKKWSQ